MAEHLRRARDVLARPGAWNQNDFAADRTGRTVDSRCSTADRFCCSGALYVTAYPGDRTVLARIFLQKAVGGDIEVWNDTPDRHRHEVNAAFDRAILLATAACDVLPAQPGERHHSLFDDRHALDGAGRSPH